MSAVVIGVSVFLLTVVLGAMIGYALDAMGEDDA